MFKIFSTYIVEYIYKMQHLEVSSAVRPIYGSLGVKGVIRIPGQFLANYCQVLPAEIIRVYYYYYYYYSTVLSIRLSDASIGLRQDTVR